MLTNTDKQWVRDEMSELRREIKNDILTSQDIVVGRIQRLDDEIAALSYRQMRHSEQIVELQEKVGLPVTEN